MKKEVGYGVALMGALAGAGALAAALIRKKKREEIYHEAELKAMNELDEMMSEGCTGDDSDCGACSCAQECAEAAAEAAAEASEESPAEDAPVEDAPAAEEAPAEEAPVESEEEK